MILRIAYFSPSPLLSACVLLWHAVTDCWQLLVMMLSFLAIAVEPSGSDRLANTITLFLTMVAFKLVVKQSLPTISYLTYLVSLSAISYLTYLLGLSTISYLTYLLTVSAISYLTYMYLVRLSAHHLLSLLPCTSSHHLLSRLSCKSICPPSSRLHCKSVC